MYDYYICEMIELYYVAHAQDLVLCLIENLIVENTPLLRGPHDHNQRCQTYGNI